MSFNETYLYFISEENRLTFVFGLIGLIGTILAIFTWISHLKTKESYNYLFKIAEKNMDADITEAELKEKKDEVEMASNRIKELQKQIRKDIPLEAKRAVLKDKLNSQIEQLKTFLYSTKNIQKELEKIDESSVLPNELLKAVENEISPEYLIREKRSNLKTLLTIITTAAAISSTILPYRELSWFILLLGVPILISLTKTMPRNKINKIKILYMFLFVMSALMILIGIFFILIWKYQSGIYFDVITLYVAIGNFMMATIVLISGIFIKQGIGKKEVLKYIREKRIKLINFFF